MVFRYKADPTIETELDETAEVEGTPLCVVRVLSELEFINEFKRPPGHQYWQTIDFMQTTLKIVSLSGLGKQYLFTFVAPSYKTHLNRRTLPKSFHPCSASGECAEDDD